MSVIADGRAGGKGRKHQAAHVSLRHQNRMNDRVSCPSNLILINDQVLQKNKLLHLFKHQMHDFALSKLIHKSVGSYDF